MKNCILVFSINKEIYDIYLTFIRNPRGNLNEMRNGTLIFFLYMYIEKYVSYIYTYMYITIIKDQDFNLKQMQNLMMNFILCFSINKEIPI